MVAFPEVLQFLQALNGEAWCCDEDKSKNILFV